MFYFLKKTKFFVPIMAINVVIHPAIAQEEIREFQEQNLVELDCNLIDSGGYKLGPGDRIRINNIEGADYSGDHQIPTDGTISVPMIGSVSIGGLTLEEATNLITAKYRRFFKYPQININVRSVGPLEVVVAGEVSAPATYIMSREDQTQHRGIEQPTVMDAIERSGGITLSGDPSQVLVRRPQRNGVEEIIYQNLWAFLRTGDRCENIGIQNGDTIYVPLAAPVNLSEIRQLATATFAEDLETPRTVAVLGSVTRPGPYVVTGGDTQVDARSDGLPTLTRAIQLAGGISASAAIEDIQVKRTTKTGAELTFEVNLQEFLREGDISQDLVLQDGDVIFVPIARNANLSEIRQLNNTSLAAELTEPRRVVVVGEVQRPGPYIIKVRDPFVKIQVEGLPTVTRAIQLAGGVRPTADIRRVRVRRLLSDGSEQILSLDLWELLESGDVSQDLILEEGDTVFIPEATEIIPSEARELAAASFAPEAIKVYVVGEAIGAPVTPPRPEVEFPPNTSLNQAILASGVIYWGRISLESVELVRLNFDGTVTRREVKLDLNAGINEETNPILRDKDIIVVRLNGVAKLTDTLQTIGESMLFVPRVETVLRILGFLGIIENQLREEN